MTNNSSTLGSALVADSHQVSNRMSSVNTEGPDSVVNSTTLYATNINVQNAPKVSTLTFPSDILPHKAQELCQNQTQQTVSITVPGTTNDQPVLSSISSSFTGFPVVTVSQPTTPSIYTSTQPTIPTIYTSTQPITPTIYTSTQVLQIVSDPVVLPSINTVGVLGLQLLQVPDLVTMVSKPEIETTSGQSEIETSTTSQPATQGSTVIYINPD